MFKIARTTRHFSGIPGLAQAHPEIFGQFCACESWTGDLSNGRFTLGDRTAALHGLSDNECGLLNFVRRYEPADRNHVLALFEQAATSSSTFCFSTTIVMETGQHQPIFCIGESSGLEARNSGVIAGVFLFPHFLVEGTPVAPKQ